MDKKVVKYEDCHPYYSSASIMKAKRMANAILEDIDRGAYKPGARNNIAVDLACVCHVLNIDAIKLFDELCVGMYAEQRDFEERVKVIEQYLPYWDNEVNGVFDKMFLDSSEVEDSDTIYIELEIGEAEQQ